MDNLEKQVLENLFDSLDRLFDRKCQVADVYDLLFASEFALKSLDSNINLSEYTQGLIEILRNGDSDERQRESALCATDSLRVKLNELLQM